LISRFLLSILTDFIKDFFLLDEANLLPVTIFSNRFSISGGPISVRGGFWAGNEADFGVFDDI